MTTNQDLVEKLTIRAALKTVARITKSLGRAAAFEADLQYLLG